MSWLSRPVADLDSSFRSMAWLAALGWSLVSACGVLALETGRPPRLGLAGVTTGSAAIAASVALVLLAVTASGDYGEDAFDDVLLQSWPLLPLLPFAGDWVRRSRRVSAGPA